MAGNGGLVEDDVLLGIDARRDHGGGHFAGIGDQFLRVLPHGDRMHVDDAENALEVVLEGNPVADCAEIVAEMEVAGGLNAGEDAAHEFGPLG